MTESDLHLIVGFFFAIGAALIAAVSARVGLPGRTLQMTYFDRQVNVLSALQEKHKDSLTSKDLEELEKEIKFIVDEVLGMSGRVEAEKNQLWTREWHPQNPLMRVFGLPRPRSVMGWVLSVTTYVYLIVAIVYLVALLLILISEHERFIMLSIGEALVFFAVGFLACLVIFAFLRHLSLIVTRRDFMRAAPT